MQSPRILILESGPTLARWAEEEGRRLGLEVSAHPSVRDVEDELSRGHFEFIIGHLNGDGERLEAISMEIRPRLIPLLPPSPNVEDRRTRIGLLLGAIGKGYQGKRPFSGRLTRELSRWIDSQFEEEIERRHDQLIRSYRPALRAIGHLDFYVRDHSRRVGHYARRIGKAAGLDSEDVRLLSLGGWVHDAGKIRISTGTLNRPGPLEPDEWKAMKSHPEWGAEIVEPCSNSDELLEMVLYHHERMDGKGYPARLRGGEIPLLARILAVADAYDAITHDRPYRGRATHATAVREILAGAGTQFDPKIAHALLAARLDQLPV